MIPDGSKNQSSMTNRLAKGVTKGGIFDDGNGLGAMPYLIQGVEGRNGASNGSFIYGLTSFICAKRALYEVLFVQAPDAQPVEAEFFASQLHGEFIEGLFIRCKGKLIGYLLESGEFLSEKAILFVRSLQKLFYAFSVVDVAKIDGKPMGVGIGVDFKPGF